MYNDDEELEHERKKAEGVPDWDQPEGVLEGHASEDTLHSDVTSPAEEPVVEKRGLTETSYKLSEEEFSRLLPGREYQWEIVGDTASGRQLFSPIRTFKVPSR